MNRRRRCVALLPFAGVIALGSGTSCSPPAPSSPAPEQPPRVVSVTNTPAMCPWRTPEADMRAFFPGATGSRLEPLILSSLRLEILRRMGPGGSIASNALYAYRVFAGNTPCGTVLVQRTAGEYGALEIVVAIDPDRRLTGIRLQRYREPPSIAAVLTAPCWLAAFRGKGPTDAFEIGRDLPAMPLEARESARAMARAVRSALIEFDVAETHAAASRRS